MSLLSGMTYSGTYTDTADEGSYVSYLGLQEFITYKDPENPDLKFNSGTK